MPHTPGPWFLDRRGLGTLGSVETEDGDVIAQAMQVEDDPKHEKRTANARLIAAAPDHALVARLLASGVLRWIDSGLCLYFDGLHQSCYGTTLDEFGVPILTDELRRDIAKVEGL